MKFFGLSLSLPALIVLGPVLLYMLYDFIINAEIREPRYHARMLKKERSKLQHDQTKENNREIEKDRAKYKPSEPFY